MEETDLVTSLQGGQMQVRFQRVASEYIMIGDARQSCDMRLIYICGTNIISDTSSSLWRERQ